MAFGLWTLDFVSGQLSVVRHRARNREQLTTDN